MNDAHLDKGGRQKNVWYCTSCDTRIDDEVINSYPETLDPNFKQAKCHRCKKFKVIKRWEPKAK